MSAFSSRTLRWVPRLSFLLVSSANQRSTRFSHQLAPVGVKWRTKLGWASSQRLIAGVLWVAALSRIRCTSSSAGTCSSISLQELLELDRAVAGVERPDHLAGDDLERGEEARWCRCACSRGSPAAAAPGSIGSVGAVLSSAWIWLFSSTQSTTRTLGRIEIKPDDVTDLVDKQRVLGQLPVSLTRWGANPNARQTFEHRPSATSPEPSGHRRLVDQCVPPSGGADSSVLHDHILDLVIGHAPRPARARTRPEGPPARSSTNRPRHFRTVGDLTPTRSATP